MKSADRDLGGIMSRQFGLATLDQARRAGLSTRQVEQRVIEGRWIRCHPRVFALAGAGQGPEAALLAACLAAGPEAAASHLSAAWLLGLAERPPGRPVVTVPYARRPRLRGVDVHRSRDLDPARILLRRAIPYTDGLRCLCDVAAEVGRGEVTAGDLDRLVDRALAAGTVTTGGLLAEIARRARTGRRGPGQLKAVLRGRGLDGGPEPSVLEAETMRLFRRFGINVVGREIHAGPDGRYRLDFLVMPGLAVEVDGFVYHWSPEAKSHDDARRNRLRLAGVVVLVYSWRDIRFEGRRVAAEIRAATRQLASPTPSVR